VRILAPDGKYNEPPTNDGVPATVEMGVLYDDESVKSDAKSQDKRILVSTDGLDALSKAKGNILTP